MILKSQRNNNNHYVKNPKDPGTAEVNSLSNNVKSEPQKSYKIEISWRSTFLIALVHLFALKGGILLLTGQVSPAFFLIGYIHGAFAGLGTTAGAHRLWAHKSYKAKLPLRIILAYMQTVACQNSIYEWVRDHRVHHKFSETDADPHNAKRGFFFAHVGWLLCRKHEDVKVKGKTVDMTDLEEDAVVMFQKKYFLLLAIPFAFIFPTLVPYYLLHIDLLTCWYVTMLRYALSLNFTWLVNSAAHIWGHKPYDRQISPSENIMVSALAFGEGSHNYHHVFPFDYRAAEFDSFIYNFTTKLIDFFAWIGWAYDLKTVPPRVIRDRVKRTGDGSHPHYVFDEKNDKGEEPLPSWGWDDPDNSKELLSLTQRISPKVLN